MSWDSSTGAGSGTPGATLGIATRSAGSEQGTAAAAPRAQPLERIHEQDDAHAQQGKHDPPMVMHEQSDAHAHNGYGDGDGDGHGHGHGDGEQGGAPPMHGQGRTPLGTDNGYTRSRSDAPPVRARGGRVAAETAAVAPEPDVDKDRLIADLRQRVRELEAQVAAQAQLLSPNAYPDHARAGGAIAGRAAGRVDGRGRLHA